MKSRKSWRIFGIASVLTLLFLLLAVAGLAIGQLNTDTPEMSIAATNLSFSDSVYITYAVSCENIEDTENVRLLVWEKPDSDYAVGTESLTLTSEGTVTLSGEKCLVFNYRGIAAKEMTDSVYVRAVYEKSGKTYCSDVKKYSVLTYVYKKLGYTGTPTQNETLAKLLEGLLEYGASAQNYFDYKTNALATSRHFKVTLENGYFADGCTTTLAVPGTKLTVTAPLSCELGSFAYWQDAQGNMVTSSSTYELTVGETDSTLTAVYISCIGGNVEGAGANLSEDSFARTEHSIDSENAIEVTASELQSLISSGLAAGKVYKVTDGNTITVSSSINGNGAAIIAPAGVVFNGLNNTTVTNLVVRGHVTVKNSSNLTFTMLDVECDDLSAVKVDKSNSNLKFDDCRIVSKATLENLTVSDAALYTEANNTTLANSYVSGVNGFISNDTVGAVVSGCEVNATLIGIADMYGEDAIFDYNTVIANGSPIAGIAVSGSVNSLISFNKVNGVSPSIQVENSLNSSVLFNGVYSIMADSSTNTYIVENNLTANLILSKNNYLLCDENTYGTSGLDHSPVMSGNQNINGNNITDVDARADVGANEDILPHTNKDLFLGMTPKSTVKDATGETSLSLSQYILTNAKGKSIVIVPPGYYTVEAKYTYTSEHSNTRIYAYGVYNETIFHNQTETNPATNEVYQNIAFQFGGAKNVEIHGLTVGYNHQSAGQVHVLKKQTSGSWTKTYTLTLVTAAGYIDSFGSLDTATFSSGSFDLVKQGEIHWSSYSYSGLTKNSDGTMTMTVSQDVYNNIVAGDVLYCRLAGDNQSTIYLGSGAENITFKDCTIYGYAAGLAFVGAHFSNGATLERVHNTVHSAYIIDKATYDKYAAWESSYGVELVSIDSEGRYRGTTPIVGSVDATHLNAADKGFHVISSLFENMCDDGSNHRGSSSRLHGYNINNDGTVTLYIKANIAEYYRNDNINKGVTSVTSNPTHIDAGDNIYIYTSNGELFCDTVSLTTCVNTNTTTSISFDSPNSTTKKLTYTLKIYEIKVDASACNFDVLEGYDLTDNDYTMSQKVLVDNMARNSIGGHFDNVLVQNIRSRGFLAKSTDITIEHCTFRNVAMTGVLMSIEPTWGESTVSINIIVRNTLFDSTGFRSDSFDSDPTLAPIAISTLTTYGNHATDSLRAENIVIEGNEFRNYGHSYGIYVNGAKDVHILNNVFKPLNASTQTKYVEIITAADIEISGNKDANGNSITINQADDAAYIHGDNVKGSSLSDTDIFINGTHIMYYHVVADKAENHDIATSAALALSKIDSYQIKSAKSARDYTILLVARNNGSEGLSDGSYTVSCNGNVLTITAETRGALVYAVTDYAERLSAISDKSYNIKSGDSITYSFTAAQSIPATNTEIFKYVGMWQATDANNPTTMVSYWDSAYVEFDFTGTSATILFSSPSTCNVSIDGGTAQSYNVESELTITASTSGKHTVRVHYGDKSAHMYFAGVRVPQGETVSRTADKPFYIQFIGDSISDASASFSHNTAALLGWDYSVIACEAVSLQADKGYWRYNNGFSNDGGYTAGSMADLLNKNFGTVSIGMEDAFFKLGIPNKNFPAAGSAEFNDIAANYYTDKYDFNFNTGYTPDIVFIFLGTNDLSGGSTQTDINNFVAKYKEFVANILAVYGSDTKICAMQALSTSDSSDMYNTNHPRYKAIAQAASELESLYGDKFNFIDAATVQSWNVEISSDSTHPTTAGYKTLTSNIAKYLYSAYVDQSFINHSFDISGIRKYTSSWGGRDSSGTDNGIAYSHFAFSSTGHINISGQNDNSSWFNQNENRPIKINGSTGQYLVLMYRASGNTHFTLELRTASSSDKSTAASDTNISKVQKGAGLVSTGWEVAVVDLSQFPNYTCNATNLRVQVRITTSMSSFDIAYAALVDSVEEAEMIARFKLGQGKMIVYEDFSAKGETVYLTEEAYYEDLKASLDYVNLNYDMSTFRKYLSANNSTNLPDKINVDDGDGIKYTRFCFTSNGHVFFNGANGAVSTVGGSGRYFIMKYRATNNSHITFEATTSDKNTLSKITRPAELMPEKWEIAVVDLAQFANYTTNSDNNVYIRFTSTCDSLDIAFAAVVDTIQEAEDYISVVSRNDTSYILYENWATAGVGHKLP